MSGQWKLDEWIYGNGRKLLCITDDTDRLAVLDYAETPEASSFLPSKEDAIKNAKLMVAAQEMLEFLQSSECVCETMGKQCHRCRIIEKAGGMPC